MAEAMLPLAKEAVPTDPAKIAAAGKAFKNRAFPDTKPDVTALKKGLVFYLPLDEGDRPSLKDSIGGAEGKIIGKATHCEGLFGKGISIPYSADRNKPNSIEFSGFKDPVTDGAVKNLSVSFWVRTTRGSGETISKYDRVGKASMKNGWRMILDPYGKTGMNAIFDSVPEDAKTGPKIVSAVKAGKATAHGDGVEWHHVVAVYNGEARTMRAYVDAGLKQSGKEAKRNYWAKDIPGNGIVPSADSLKIHQFAKSETSGIDEIAIWSRPLTDDEIKALFNNGNGVSLQ